MSGFLLDTCAISEVTRANADKGLTAWLDGADPAQVYLSVITLGEIRKGVALLSDHRKAAKLESWLTAQLPAAFSGRILPFDVDVADRWGRLLAMTQPRGLALSPIDSLIAATALHHNLSIVTRNEKHFRSAGVPITNPWRRE